MACLVYSSAETNIFQLLRLEHTIRANEKSDVQVGYDSVLKPRTIREIHLMSFMRTQYDKREIFAKYNAARRTFKSGIEHWF